MTAERSSATMLLTGATGYVGGQLLARFEARGVPVRCLTRRPSSLQSHVAPTTDVVAGDVLDPATLTPAFEGIETVYYLVHSMSAGESFAARDRHAARHVADAARADGVQRIIYLGGLGDNSHALSPHLRSRQEVGEILRGTGVPVIEFRASIILGVRTAHGDCGCVGIFRGCARSATGSCACV